MDPENSRYLISSVTRALKVLKLFDRNHRSLSLTEISAMSGLTKSSALRIMESLESEGFVKRIDSSKKYKLGLELYMISREGYDFSSLQVEAEPIIKKAVDRTGLIGHMGIIENDQVLFLSRVWPESAYESYAITAKVGGVVPVHCTGIGKVLLAYSDPETKESLLNKCNFEKFTPKTITSRRVLEEELNNIRKQGFGINCEEHEPYVTCLTYPVFNYRNKIIAAVSLTGLTQIINEKDQSLLHEIMQQLTHELQQECGYWKAH